MNMYFTFRKKINHIREKKDKVLHKLFLDKFFSIESKNISSSRMVKVLEHK